jgi:hypothetical protein
MARYPVLEEPLPPGVLTLDDYASRAGRSKDYIRIFWRPRAGFPDPVGELRATGRHGGGRGKLAYSQAALDQFRAANPDLWGRGWDSALLEITDRSPDERISLGNFAKHVADTHRTTVTHYRGQDRFPQSGDDGLYRLGDLVHYWNHGRPSKQGPSGQNGEAAKSSGPLARTQSPGCPDLA